MLNKCLAVHREDIVQSLIPSLGSHMQRKGTKPPFILK